jgi:hypothetical protein
MKELTKISFGEILGIIALSLGLVSLILMFVHFYQGADVRDLVVLGTLSIILTMDGYNIGNRNRRKE